jgi:hypothetical protein
MPDSATDSASESSSASNGESESGSASSGQPVDPCADDPCVHGTCTAAGPTAVCDCDFGYGGDTCDAVAQPFCLRGTLTVDNAFDMVNGNVATGAFEHLEGNTIDFNIVFDVPDSSVLLGTDGQLRILEAEIVDAWFDDAFMNDSVGAAYVDMTYDGFTLVHGTSDGIEIGNFVSPEAAEYWGFESFFTELPLAIDDATGFPLLFPALGEGMGSVYLRRYIPQSPYMTDYAQSTWTISFLNGDDC